MGLPPMEFMSDKHVAAMNALLLNDSAVRAECSRLPVPYVIEYELLNGPGQKTVRWHVSFADTVQFALTGHPAPHLVAIMQWRDMVLSSSAGRTGESHHAPVRYEGDDGALLATRAAFAAAREAATLPITFPEI